MTDRVAHDHPTVETIRARAVATATGRRLEIPAADADVVPHGDVVRVVCDGTEHFARIDRAHDGETPVVYGVYDTPGHARDPGEGSDRLADWLDAAGIDDEGSVLLDVVEPDFLYGLRAPGADAVYEAKRPPSDSLASIAADLEARRDADDSVDP